MTEWKVPLFQLDLGNEERRMVEAVLESNWLTMGQVTASFEKAFAEYLGVKHAFGVCSGTAALHLAHYAAGVGPGDEVICPALTFVATANSIVYTGATPVFADITSLDDLTISPADIESKITDRTKGIVVMHYAGFPCHMDAIMQLAKKYNLYVVEDAAHSPGAEYHPPIPNDASRLTPHAPPPQKLGTIGDLGCFSFFGNKNMTTGEGGMIVTDNDLFAEKIKRARSHGMTSLTWDRYKGHSFSYDVVSPGFNYRIDEIHSALGLAQLQKLNKYNKKRCELSALYRRALGNMKGIEIPFGFFTGKPSYHIFPVILSKEIDRESFMNYLKTQGIQTSVHYLPIHHFSYYREVMRERICLNLTEEVGCREVTLPLFPTMTASQVEFVVQKISDYIVAMKSGPIRT